MNASGNTAHENIGKIKEWLLAKNPGVTDIDMNQDLIENRIIDSLAFMEFIYLLEEITERENLIEDIDIDSLRTLQHINDTYLVS